jgi:hypothetical protein
MFNLTEPLSRHFTLAEFVVSETAARRGLDNTPTEVVVNRLRILCDTILEPARAMFGPLHIASGYRAPKLNRLVGGSATSAHLFGYAADVVPLRVSKLEFADWLRQHCRFDQIILEFGTKDEPAWVHVSCDARLRGEFLRATSAGYFPAQW